MLRANPLIKMHYWKAHGRKQTIIQNHRSPIIAPVISIFLVKYYEGVEPHTNKALPPLLFSLLISNASSSLFSFGCASSHILTFHHRPLAALPRWTPCAVKRNRSVTGYGLTSQEGGGKQPASKGSSCDQSLWKYRCTELPIHISFFVGLVVCCCCTALCCFFFFA